MPANDALIAVTNKTTAQSLAELQDSVSAMWVLVCTFMAVSMQLGFAMLEVGSVRRTHRMTVLVKNIMDSAVSALCFWLFSNIWSDELVRDRNGVKVLYLSISQWMFCGSSVTICSGAMAERAHVTAYLTFAAIYSGFIYPSLATSVWTSDGWLTREFHSKFHDGYDHHDFAGGGVVHIAGGTAAFVGASLLGRRIIWPYVTFPGKHALRGESSTNTDTSPARPSAHSNVFNDLEEQDERHQMMARPVEGWQRRFECRDRDTGEFVSNTYLQVIGMFTLWVGWYGFNASSTRCMSTAACVTAAGIVAWNTTLSGCAGGCGAYLYCFSVHKNLQVGFLCNGLLSGLVAITSCCDVATEGAAIGIGLAAGMIVYPSATRIMQALKVDDPVGAIPVHLFSGIFGVLMGGLCKPDCHTLKQIGGGGLREEARFCLETHSIGKQFLAQLWGVFTEIWWTSCCAMFVFSTFAIMELARASEIPYFDMADELVQQMVAGAANHGESSEMARQWQKVEKGSDAARRVLKRHGWTGTGFSGEGGAPNDVFRLGVELRHARGEKAETALEVETFPPLKFLGRCLYQCAPLRRCFLLRLRIAPISEICGLGAADLDGGQLYHAMQKVLNQVTDEKMERAPLQDEVRELRLAVKTQESMLNAIVHGGGRSSDDRRRARGVFSLRRGLRSPSVPTVLEGRSEDGSPEDSEGSSTPTSSRDVLATMYPSPERIPPPAPHPSAPAPAPRADASSFHVVAAAGATPHQRVSLPAMGSVSSLQGSDRTVSDRSMGAITPRSAGDDTPPPSVFGRSADHHGRRNDGGHGHAGVLGGIDPARVSDVAAHLSTVLAAQQALLAQLQVAAGATPNGVGSPYPYGGAAFLGNIGTPSTAALLSALQQVADARSGTSTPTSRSTQEGGYARFQIRTSSSIASSTTDSFTSVPQRRL